MIELYKIYNEKSSKESINDGMEGKLKKRMIIFSSMLQMKPTFPWIVDQPGSPSMAREKNMTLSPT
jgi:hypothetical protein